MLRNLLFINICGNTIEVSSKGIIKKESVLTYNKTIIERKKQWYSAATFTFNVTENDILVKYYVRVSPQNKIQDFYEVKRNGECILRIGGMPRDTTLFS